MKIAIIITLWVLPLTVLAQKGTYVIQGKLDSMTSPAKIYLVNAENKTVLDSTSLKDGSFDFKGIVEEVTPAYLLLTKRDSSTKENKESVFFYLEKGEITVKGTGGQFRKSLIDGTPNNAAIIEYARIDERIEYLNLQIQKKQNDATQEQRQSEVFKKEIDRMKKGRLEEGKDAYAQFARSHPNAVISLMALTELLFIEDQKTLIPLFQNLSPQLKNSAKGKKFVSQLANRQKVAVGVMAPDFTIADTSGSMHSLSSLRGKYVLLDFWASWCGPCRQENPNLKKEYEKYKDKNFTILSVSIDAAPDKRKWLLAIQHDKMTWTQLSELKGWKSDVVKLYGIVGIPENFLIDPTGKISAENLRGEVLEKQLSAIFDKSPKVK